MTRLINLDIKQILIPVINRKYGINLLWWECELSNIKPSTVEGANTEVTITIASSSLGYKGAQKFYYDRPDIGLLLTGLHRKLALRVEELSPENVLPILQKDYGLALTLGDIARVYEENKMAVVEIQKDCPLFTGKVLFDYYSGDISLEDLIGVYHLDGFTIPYHTPGKIQAIPYSYRFNATAHRDKILSCREGQFVDEELRQYIAGITGDNWKLDTETTRPFNLGGAYFMFVGYSNVADSKGFPANLTYTYSASIVLTERCSNLGGILLLNFN